jgi:putative sigma-54 modulation protein
MQDLSGQPAGGVATIVEEDVVEDDVLPQVVKSKRFYLAPMTPDDAILKMDLLGHGFFFFINKDTNRSAVIYKRDDGDIGLIDEAG